MSTHDHAGQIKLNLLEQTLRDPQSRNSQIISAYYAVPNRKHLRKQAQDLITQYGKDNVLQTIQADEPHVTVGLL